MNEVLFENGFLEDIIRKLNAEFPQKKVDLDMQRE